MLALLAMSAKVRKLSPYSYYIVAAAVWFAERGLDLTGFQSMPVGVVCWGVSLGLVELGLWSHIPHKYRATVMIAVGVLGMVLIFGGVYYSPARQELTGTEELQRDSPLIPHRTERLSDEPASPPFSVLPLTSFVSAKRESAAIWISYRSGYGSTLSPVHLALHLTLTVLKPTPSMIDSFSLSIKAGEDEWIQLLRLPNSGGPVFWMWSNLKEAKILTFGDGFLMDAISNRMLAPGDVAKGWVFYEAPPVYNSLSRPLRYRVHITDTAGAEYIGEIRPPEVGGDVTRYTALTVVPTLVDVTSYKIKLYSDPVQAPDDPVGPRQ